ncbi:MAG TPA: hypothetical protein PK370_01380 [Candidatus Woesebacteria bacterium]|nr:hypothetical protein [Candidatus Woesebacteria bacterium]HPJ17244.1 hypothetical protein [Candidatus Woesebacteria bacterium]
MTGNKNNTKNTLKTPQSTQPITNRIPPKNPSFSSFAKPVFRGPNFNSSNAFRNQNRGSGGK